MNANQRTGLSASPPLLSSSLSSSSSISTGSSSQQQQQIPPASTSSSSAQYKPASVELKFQHTVELKTALNKGRKLSHKRHMRKLQKELDYLQDTAWMYPSVDKLLGQN